MQQQQEKEILTILNLHQESWKESKGITYIEIANRSKLQFRNEILKVLKGLFVKGLIIRNISFESVQFKITEKGKQSLEG